MEIRRLKPGDDKEWFRLRAAHLPSVPRATHLEAMNQIYRDGSRDDFPAAVFVAEGDDGKLHGFAEATVRPRHDDTDTRPVGFLECWHVEKDHRRRGIGRQLLEEVEVWLQVQGCEEIVSETHIDDGHGILGHRGVGFDEVDAVVRFKKRIKD